MSAAYVLLLFCLGLARTVHADCPRPEGGQNMFLSNPPNFPVPDGSKVTFECEVGYRKIGSPATITCSGGQWSSLMIRCEIRNCGSADDVLNGYVEYNGGTEFGASAKAVCNHGFSVVGVPNRIDCGVQGWMGRLGTCEAILCDPPAAIVNGYFEPVKDEYGVSEVITYRCNGEYVLKGNTTLECIEKRVYNSAPPTCVLVQCPAPVVINGQAVAGARPPYKHMSSVTFRCNPGFKMEGKDTVSCNVNSIWAPALPQCIQIECKAPQLANGEVVDGPRLSYKYQETVTLKCNDGFELSGVSTLTCGGDNQWTPKLPECTEIQCKTPEVKDGKLVGAPRPSYKYSESVTFECNTGFTMSGQRTVKCGQNKQWTPTLPQCTHNNGYKVKAIVGTVLGLLGAAVIGAAIYFGIAKKKKG